VVFLPVGNGDLKRIGSKTRVVAVGMPNVEDKRLETGDWRSYLTSVDKLESAIKLDLLSNLPDSIEKQLEARIDSGN
jgi:endonuclease G